MAKKPQDYRLVAEFTLRNPGDYAATRAQFLAVKNYLETYFPCIFDIMTIEKIDRNKDRDELKGANSNG